MLVNVKHQLLSESESHHAHQVPRNKQSERPAYTSTIGLGVVRHWHRTARISQRAVQLSATSFQESGIETY